MRLSIFIALLLLLSNRTPFNQREVSHKNGDRSDLVVNNILALDISQRSVVGICRCKDKGYTIKNWSITTGVADTLLVGYVDTLSSGSVDTLWGERIQEIRMSHNGSLFGLRAFGGSDMLGVFSMEKKKWLWKHKEVYYSTFAFSEVDQDLVAIDQNSIEYFAAHSGEKTEKKNLVENNLSDYADGVKRFMRSKLSQNGKYVIVWNEKTRDEWGIITLLSIFSSPPNPNIAVWDILENKLVSEIQKPSSGIVSVSFGPDGRTVFLSCGDKKIKMWSLTENKVIKEIDGSYLDISASNDLLAVVEVGEGHLRILNYLTFEPVKDFGNVGDKFGRLSKWSFSIDGKYFALEVEGILYLYETNNWKLCWSVPTCPRLLAL